jgi:hypothetical protein
MDAISKESEIKASGESASGTNNSISSSASVDSRLDSSGLDCHQASLFSQEAHLASHFQKLAEEKAQEMLATSGQRCSALYGCSGQSTSSSRMFLDLLLSGMELFLTRWSPIWSPRNTRSSHRLWFRLRVSAHGTEETGFGFWPTATTVPDAPNTNSNQVNGFTSLGTAMRLMPTANVPNGGRVAKAGSMNATGQTEKGKRQVDLQYFVRNLMPTPTEHDKHERYQKHAQGGTPLTMAVRMMPTPTAITNRGGAAMCKWGGARSRKTIKEILGTSELNGALNPEWVEWFMGYPQGWTDSQGLATQSSRYIATGLLKP